MLGQFDFGKIALANGLNDGQPISARSRGMTATYLDETVLADMRLVGIAHFA